MLRFLSVQNLAVIESLEVEFDPGLNVLTGETGAGKSILVGAVGLLLGGRASPELVRTGRQRRRPGDLRPRHRRGSSSAADQQGPQPRRFVNARWRRRGAEGA
jgi:predicted ATP-dependent endonuclease of OLD family